MRVMAIVMVVMLGGCEASQLGRDDLGGQDPDGGSGSDGSGGGDAGDAGGGGGDGFVPQTGSGIFPATSILYQDISNAPVDSAWATIRPAINTLGGWGGAGGKIEMNFEFHVLSADQAVARRAFTQDAPFFYGGECDTAAIPVPAVGAIEAQTTYACDTGADDCHLLVIQGTRLYEAYKANINGGTQNGTPFTSGCLAIWDLTHDYWQPVAAGAVFSRGDHCSSADAGGFPIAGMLFSADECAAGEIKHAIRFILPNDRIRSDVYVHPATHAAGSGATDVLPYGARLRLKASVDLSGLKPWAQVVARAMKKYGMFLADGGKQALTGQADLFTTAKWGTNLTQNDLGALKIDDFEMVEGGTRIPKSGNCPHVEITN